MKIWKAKTKEEIKMKVTKETIIRTAITFIALINSVLTVMGKNPLPWSETEMFEGLSALLTVITTAWSWWKNNSFTQNALLADSYMKKLKTGGEIDEKKRA